MDVGGLNDDEDVATPVESCPQCGHRGMIVYRIGRPGSVVEVCHECYADWQFDVS